jgi:hypothetical protein
VIVLVFNDCLACSLEKSDIDRVIYKQHIFLIVLSLGKSKIKVPADKMSGEVLVPSSSLAP